MERGLPEDVGEAITFVQANVNAGLKKAIRMTRNLPSSESCEFEKIASAIKNYVAEKINEEAKEYFFNNNNPVWEGIPIEDRAYGFVNRAKSTKWTEWLVGLSVSTPISELEKLSGVDGREIFAFLSYATSGIESAYFHNECWFYDVYGKKPVVRIRRGVDNKKIRAKGTLVMMDTMDKHQTVGGFSINFQDLWAMGELARGYPEDQRATARKAFDRIYEPFNRTQ